MEAPLHGLVTPPTPEETLALERAARYLMRAGTEAATRLLGCDTPDGQAELWAAFADSLLASAALCNGLTSSMTEAFHAAELHRWARALP